MARSFECPKCGEDIGESYQSEEADVGISGGWYCAKCNVGYPDEDGGDDFSDLELP